MNDKEKQLILSLFGSEYATVINSAVDRAAPHFVEDGHRTLSDEAIIYRMWDQWDTLQPAIDAEPVIGERRRIAATAAIQGPQ